MLLNEHEVQACDYAMMLMNTNRSAEAVEAFTDILMKNDKNALAWNNRGIALMNLGHPFDAVLNMDKAAELEPHVAQYQMNRGVAYYDCEMVTKAIDAYRKALELDPNLAMTHMNLGNALKYTGNLQTALQHYRTSVKLDPNSADSHINLGFAALAAGLYKEGWAENEWRWKTSQMSPRGLKIKEWDGSPLEGKTLLIYAEQGMGDALQFIRFAPLVKKKYGGKILVEVRQPLTRLMKTIPGIDGIITFGELVPEKDIDYMVAMMSLPHIMGTTVETIPWSGPYFKADPFRTSLWREYLKQLPPGLLVGVCWAGLSRPGRPLADAIDRKRSTTLQSFAPLAKVPGVSWVSLQKGLPRDQVGKPPSGMTIGDWTDMLDDFYDTAALIECLDLVISVDTSVIHLAAGMGKPTWLLSRWDGCWRWLGTRSDSPWYPSLRQFCQPQPHAWEPMMAAAAVALRDLVKESSKKAA